MELVVRMIISHRARLLSLAVAMFRRARLFLRHPHRLMNFPVLLLPHHLLLILDPRAQLRIIPVLAVLALLVVKAATLLVAAISIPIPHLTQARGQFTAVPAVVTLAPVQATAVIQALVRARANTGAPVQVPTVITRALVQAQAIT